MQPLPTFGAAVPREVLTAIRNLHQELLECRARCTVLERQIATMPRPLSMQEINRGLSAGGSAPLNLTGLVGAPVTTP